jgi:hypothetical protein
MDAKRDKTVQCRMWAGIALDRIMQRGCGSPYCCFVLSNPSLYSQSSAEVIMAFNLSFSAAAEGVGRRRERVRGEIE